MKTLAIAGSLRGASINASLLRAAARLAPPGMTVEVYRGIGGLPLFNPDLEPSLPNEVAALHAAVAAADALLIASPEYAHGVTGAMKNALDWLVSFESFVYKPVAILNASARAYHADAALRETLRTMSAVIVESASARIPLDGIERTEEGMIASAAASGAIRDALASLDRAVRLRQSASGPMYPSS